MKKKIALVLAGTMILAGLSGCGNKEEESTAPVSTATTATEQDVVATGNDATEGDAETADTATDGDASAYYGEASVGYIEDEVYYNDMFGFRLDLSGTDWTFYGAEEVANVTGMEQEEVEALWNGEKSPYEESVTYCAIAYDTNTGTNIIVTYVNAEKAGMSGLSAKNYLELGASSYEGAEVTETEYLGRTYAVLNLPQGEDANYANRMYATTQNDLIAMITFTVMDEDDMDTVVSMLTTGNEAAEETSEDIENTEAAEN